MPELWSEGAIWFRKWGGGGLGARGMGGGTGGGGGEGRGGGGGGGGAGWGWGGHGGGGESLSGTSKVLATAVDHAHPVVLAVAKAIIAALPRAESSQLLPG